MLLSEVRFLLDATLSHFLDPTEPLNVSILRDDRQVGQLSTR
ncbi:unnamed protein product [Schistosoma margrebowiei]|uniref:Uncharacterized protein n=1 Tax=Schistosoma margrebowiei TaxID=48269 RepID=A0A183LNC5_9TREM|nr:unnamed protein product [Schistosoma margrebowiei]